MRSGMEADGHDTPGPVNELVPDLATVADKVLARLEDAVREPVVAHELSRMNWQTFSTSVWPALGRTGFKSGHFGRSGARVMVSGTASVLDVCHPAWSSRTTACALGATAAAISARSGEPRCNPSLVAPPRFDVQVYRCCVAPRQHKTRAFALLGADRAENGGATKLGSHLRWTWGADPAGRPAACRAWPNAG